MKNREETGKVATPVDELTCAEELVVELLPESPFVGEVVDVRHPTLAGRALVGWLTARGERRDRWLPCLHGLAVRAADRVLVTRASNWAEPLVTGVIDGFASRVEPELSGPSLALLPDERLRITDAAGRALVDVVPTDAGPIVKLLASDVNIELEGKLRVSAREVELLATGGAVRVEARDDVVLRGETIQLN